MQKINLKQLVKDVKKLAKENPDNKYLTCDVKNCTESKCSNTKGKCTNGTTGCIVGQALRMQGFKFNRYTANKGILDIYTENNGRPPTKSIDWLESVQYAQDNGETWANAILSADEYIALIYGETCKR